MTLAEFANKKTNQDKLKFLQKMGDLNENPLKLSVKWNGKEFEIPEFSPSDSVAMLKIAIENATGVRPERQKLLNVKFQGNYLTYFQCIPTF